MSVPLAQNEEWLLWRDLSADEIEEKLNNGYDIVFLPIGSTEIHGRYLPVSTDTLISEATCLLMARKHKGLVLPSIEYTMTGATTKYPGAITVKQDIIKALVKNIIDDLIDRGIEKIVIYAAHGPNSWFLVPLVRSYYEETGHPILLLTQVASADAVAELNKPYIGTHRGYGEASRSLAARKILKRQGVTDLSHIKADAPPPPADESFRNLSKYGTVGYYYETKENHIPLTPDISWEVGYNYLVGAVESQGDLRKALEDYIAFNKKRWQKKEKVDILGYKR